MIAALLAVALGQSVTFPGPERSNESPRSMYTEIRVGPYYPWVDRPLDCAPASCSYRKKFNDQAMLLGEIEVERQLFQKLGTLSVGATVGYAEKYGHAVANGEATSETTALKIVPLKALLAYRFDYLAQKFNVPLVPYVKGGFELAHWWSDKGGKLDVANNVAALGWSYGLFGAFGLSFLLDVLDPRLARDFDTGMGVNHTYLFAEFNIAEVNDFGRKFENGTLYALDLSARYVMFGLAFEY